MGKQYIKFGKYLTVLFFLQGIMFSACVDEIERNHYTEDAIVFTASTTDTWANGELTRAVNEQNKRVEEPRKFKSEENAHTLYLHTMVQPRTDSVLTGTRGTLIHGSNQLNATNVGFGVSGYKHLPSEDWKTHTPDFYHNAEAIWYVSEWRTQTPYFYPANNEEIVFNAYSPYVPTGTTQNGMTVSGDTQKGPMWIHYQVPQNPADQIDLLTAVTPSKVFNNNTAPQYRVDLPFQHALTAVTFRLSDGMAPGKVKSISFENISMEATDTLTKGWTPTGALSDYKIDFGTSGFTIAVDADLLSGDTLLMIPQTFDNTNQQIVLEVEESDGTPHLLYCSLQGTQWIAGTVVTYLLSTSSICKLAISNVEYPTKWGDWDFWIRTHYPWVGENYYRPGNDGYTISRETYEPNKGLGVYVVDDNGTIIHENVFVEYDDTYTYAWIPSATMNYKSTFKYFAYYPYDANISTKGGRALNSTFAGTSAADFFADVIAQYPISSDQSTREKFLANDLHIGKGIPAGLSQVRFPMEHAMGLALIEPEVKTVTGTVKYTLTTDPSYTWSYTGTTVVRASDQISGYKPLAEPVGYREWEPRLYLIVRPNVATTIADANRGYSNSWSQASYQVTIGSNAHKVISPKISGSGANMNCAFTMEPGDLYYDDGSLSHLENDAITPANGTKGGPGYYSDRTPIAVVITDYTTTTDYNAGYEHGYAMALTWAGGTTLYQWATGAEASGNAFLQATKWEDITGAMDGRTLTESLYNRGGRFPAPKQTWWYTVNYLGSDSNPNGAYGWFCPSIGQLFAWLNTMTYPSLDDMWWCDDASGRDYSASGVGLPDGDGTTTYLETAYVNWNFRRRGFSALIQGNSSVSCDIASINEYDGTYIWRLRFANWDGIVIRTNTNRNGNYHPLPCIVF